MKSITIHLDNWTVEFIEQKSRETGLSMDETIKRLIHKALNITPEDQYQYKTEDFKEFLGVWSQSEFDKFQENMKDFDRIDKDRS